MKHQALFHGDLVNTTRIIYTPSEFAKTSLLHVQEIGTLQAQKPHVSKREDLDSYLFLWYDPAPASCIMHIILIRSV